MERYGRSVGLKLVTLRTMRLMTVTALVAVTVIMPSADIQRIDWGACAAAERAEELATAGWRSDGHPNSPKAWLT